MSPNFWKFCAHEKKQSNLKIAYECFNFAAYELFFLGILMEITLQESRRLTLLVWGTFEFCKFSLSLIDNF